MLVIGTRSLSNNRLATHTSNVRRIVVDSYADSVIGINLLERRYMCHGIGVPQLDGSIR